MTFEPTDGLERDPEDLPVQPVEEEESNDYTIEVRLDVGGHAYRATIEYQDGQPYQVQMGYYGGDRVPAGMVRIVQQLLHGGSGPSFKAIGQAQLQGVAAPSPYPMISRVPGPSALY